MKTRDKYSYFIKNNKSYINAIGLMSGTSLDGLDVALIKTNATDYFELKQFSTYEYSESLKQNISCFIKDRKNLNYVASLLTKFNSKCIKSFLANYNINSKEIDIIGLHGTTIFHNPKENWTWQLCDGKSLANIVNIPVISNFRYRDVCLGGEGAPLVGIWHKALLNSIKDTVFPSIFLNIGGVSNITYLEKKQDIPYSFDIGTGNGPIDHTMQKYFNVPFDEDGKISLEGSINKSVIKNILKNNWYEKLPPKSIDKSYFNVFINSLIKDLSAEDKAATLSKLISAQLKVALKFFSQKPKRLYVSGGGIKNKAILNGLKEDFDNILLPLETNWNSDAIEAQAFAYLASRSFKSIPFTWEKITGVKNKSSGGLLDFPD